MSFKVVKFEVLIFALGFSKPDIVSPAYTEKTDFY